MEPTQADVAAVNAHLGGEQAPAQPTQPAAQPQPIVEPSAQPATQPTEQAPAQPTSNDPFESFVPQAPADQPVEATAPVAPQQQPAQAPVQAQPQEFQTFDEYMDSVLAGIPQTPSTAQPKLEELDQDDPMAIQKFFADWGKSIREETILEVQRQNRLQQSEERGWNEAFEAFPSLRKNASLRDMVHNLRMGAFQQGKAMSPKQAAEKLVKELNLQYRQGAADTKVVTTIQDTQPTGGGSVEVIPQGAPGSSGSLADAASKGEEALTAALDAMVRSGKL